MENKNFISCYENNPFILTEGSVGLRISHEFGLKPDKDIHYPSLLYDSEGRKVLERVYRQYLQIAEDYSLPIMITASTRRVSRGNIDKSPYKNKNVIPDYVNFLRELTYQYKCDAFVGCVMGCKGNAYTGEGSLTVDEAILFHEWQVNECVKANVDYIFEAIMPELNEIIGLSKLIADKKIPYIVSFMIRKNGKIIDGHTIHDAITKIDDALDFRPLCYMTNCVHPDILRSTLDTSFNNTSTVKLRFKGIQANAACAEPEELDSLHELKSSNADELLNSFKLLNEVMTMKIYGGCCGTNHSHLRKIADYLNSIKKSPI